MNIKYLIIIVLLCTSFNSFSQEEKQYYLDSVYNTTNLSEIAESYFDNGWIIFKEHLKINPKELFVKHKSKFGLGINDEMILKKEWGDSLGRKHFEYHQYYGGLEVEHSVYILHSDNDILIRANGKVVPFLDIDISSNSQNNHESILDTKFEYFKGEPIGALQETIERNEDLSRYQTIAICSDKDELIKDNYKLAYKFKGNTSSENKGEVYIDSKTGAILKEKSGQRNSGWKTEEATVQTIYNGNQVFFHSWYRYTHYLSYGFNNAYNRHLTAAQTADPQGNYNCYWNGFTGEYVCSELGYILTEEDDNYWTTWKERMGASVLWAGQKTLQYFWNNWNIAGIDNNGGHSLLMWDVEMSNGPNASFDSKDNRILLGKSIPGVCNHMTSLDIIAHEYTHGVSYYTKGFRKYEGEEGALEEACSDIFAAIIQEDVEGFDSDRIYTMGEDVFADNENGNKYKRSMKDPKSFGQHAVVDFNCKNVELGQPNTYLGEYWFPGSCDHGGVHGNLSVITHWFYLLAEGGAISNDNGERYMLHGLGFETAKAIFEYAYMIYFNNNTKFLDARNGSIYAAMDLYGMCSFEYNQTVRAWNAVGVYSNGGPFAGDIVTTNCLLMNNDHQMWGKHTSAAKVTLNFGCTIAGGKKTTLLSGDKIILQPGFKVGAGAGTEFKLNIVDCY